jgi:hypothetical protein
MTAHEGHGISPLQPYRSAAVVGHLAEYLQRTLREITTPEALQISFGRLFVSEAPHLSSESSRILLYGAERPRNELFTTILAEVLEATPRAAILEIASGTTYPWRYDQNRWMPEHTGFGSAWLSRAVAKACPEARVVASDYVNPNLCIIAAVDSGSGAELDLYHWRDPVLRDHVIPLGDEAMFRPSLFLRHGKPVTLIGDSDAGLNDHLSIHLPYWARRYGRQDIDFVVRPILDAELEKRVYGLHVEGRVDMFALSSAFPTDRFDFVFGRHLDPVTYPRTPEEREALERSIRSVLAPGGSALICFDVQQDGMIAIRN